MGSNEAAAKGEDLAALVGRQNEIAMVEHWNLGDLNLEDELQVEFERECDEDGCRMVVGRITFLIENRAVKLPDELYYLVYKLASEYAQELDPFDR